MRLIVGNIIKTISSTHSTYIHKTNTVFNIELRNGAVRTHAL